MEEVIGSIPIRSTTNSLKIDLLKTRPTSIQKGE